MDIRTESFVWEVIYLAKNFSHSKRSIWGAPTSPNSILEFFSITWLTLPLRFCLLSTHSLHIEPKLLSRPSRLLSPSRWMLRWGMHCCSMIPKCRHEKPPREGIVYVACCLQSIRKHIFGGRFSIGFLNASVDVQGYFVPISQISFVGCNYEIDCGPRHHTCGKTLLVVGAFVIDQDWRFLNVLVRCNWLSYMKLFGYENELNCLCQHSFSSTVGRIVKTQYVQNVCPASLGSLFVRSDCFCWRSSFEQLSMVSSSSCAPPAWPLPPAWLSSVVLPAPPLGSTVFAITWLVPPLISLFIFFLSEMRLTTSGGAASSALICLTIGATLFFSSGMTVRPTRTAKTSRPAAEPNCVVGPLSGISWPLSLQSLIVCRFFHCNLWKFLWHVALEASSLWFSGMALKSAVSASLRIPFWIKSQHKNNVYRPPCRSAG